MTTTSSDRAAGTTITGQQGNGTGHTGRAAGLVATAALGLGLLAGGLLGHGRPAMTPRALPPGATAPRVSVALGDRDDPRFALGQGVVPNRVTYREGHYEIYDGTGTGLIGAASGDQGVRPDQPTYRESHGLDGAPGPGPQEGAGLWP